MVAFEIGLGDIRIASGGFSHVRIAIDDFGRVFLAVQSAASPFVLASHLKTMLPNLRASLEFPTGKLTGMRGRQIVTTDELGFRTTGEVDYSSGEGVRIFAIGASTTAQATNDDRETWKSLLERSLERDGTRVEVVNTGVAGVRAEHNLAMLRHVGGLHADAAIFLVGINDWNHHIVEHFTARSSAQRALASAKSARRQLALRASLLGRAISDASLRRPPARGESAFDYEGYHGGQRGSLERRVRHAFEPAQVLSSYAAVLEEISAECKRLAIPCVFVTQPTGYRAPARRKR